MTQSGINLRQLSEILGLSQTTVSRALNGYPEVGQATRQRVLAAAKAHDYSPNTRARALALGRTMTVASIVPRGSAHEVVNPVHADFIAGASEVLTAADYDLLLSTVPDADEAALYRRMARRGGVDGLIIHAPRSGDGRLPLLHASGLNFVVHGRFAETDQGYSWVDVNNRSAFAEATRRLLALGHRRIALVNGQAELVFARHRREGHEQALAEGGLSPDPALITHGAMTEDYGHAAACALLDSPEPPTAFLASSWIVALGVERACQSRGITLGRGIAMITHDDRLSYFHTDRPRFATITAPVREHGRQAAAMLLDLIANPGGAPRQLQLKATLDDGPTLCPAP